MASFTHSDWSILAISGQEAETYLQGQVTSDIQALTEQSLQLSAYCNPQGRVIATFFLWKQDNQIFMALPKSMESLVQKRLQKYAFRSQVKIAVMERTLPPHLSFTQKELIEKGIPILNPETSEMFVAQRLNLDTLGAISFNKGCYVGQEIIARLHYRGQSKHHLYHVLFDSSDIYPPSTEIKTQDDQMAGHIINSIPSEALVVMADEFANQSYFTIDHQLHELIIKTR